MDALTSISPGRGGSRTRGVVTWLKGRLRLVFGGLAVLLLMAAGTLGRPWLEALGIGSAVVSLLPCAAMCAAGLCMKGGNQCVRQEGEEANSKPADVRAVSRSPLT